ncbi:MAG: hypothetical protein IPN72_22660 [Saprospiraceae bacterium]|nr:hypothetical protein [Saprospiraceae bacterium]
MILTTSLAFSEDLSSHDNSWSTNVVEITQNMGIAGIERIEVFAGITADTFIDPMLFARYNGLDQTIFEINILPDEIVPITNIDAYNKAEGLSCMMKKSQYLKNLPKKLGRKPHRFWHLVSVKLIVDIVETKFSTELLSLTG